MQFKSTNLSNQQENHQNEMEIIKIIKKANLQLFQYHIQTTINIFQQAIEASYPERQHMILGWGSVADQKGYYEKRIIDWYKQSLKKQELKITAYDGLALCYTINKNFKQAQHYYRGMKQKFPLNYAFSYALANILFNSGQSQQAKQQYSQLLMLNHYGILARRQLIILSFYEDNIQKVKKLMQGLPAKQKDRVMLLIETLIQDYDLKHLKMKQIIEHYNDYYRPYIFQGDLLLSLGRQNDAVQCYLKCISRDKKYCIAYIQLAKIYYQKNQIQKAIKLLQEGRLFIWDDDWFMDMLLSFLYIKVKRYEQAQKCTNELLQSFNNKNLCLSERVSAFLKFQVFKIKKVIDIYQINDKQTIFKIQQTKKLYQQIMALHSIKQQHLNIRINKIIQKQNQFISVIQTSVDLAFEPSLKILLQGVQLKIGRQHYQQFVAILINKYILKRVVDKQQKWNDINKKIANQLLQFYELIKGMGNLHEKNQDNIILQENKKIYITQYVAKKYNMLQQQKYFNNYDHLYKVFKKFSKQVKNSQEKLESLTLSLYSQLNILQHQISARLDSQNLQICILQIALQLFPQLSTRKQSIFQSINTILAQKSNQRPYNLDLLNEILKKMLKIEIQNLLKQRESKKQPITCYIDNWVEIWYSFSSQKSVINAMELIKKSCRERKFQIHQYQGQLISNNKKEIIMKIKIDKVCSSIHLVYVEEQKSITLLNYLQKFINYKGGQAIGFILYLNRKFREPITQYLQEIMIELKQQNSNLAILNKNSKKISAIKQFIQNIQINFDKDISSVLQKSLLKQRQSRREKSRIQKNSNYKTNKKNDSTILNFQQTINFVDLPATSRTTNQRKSSFQNCEKFDINNGELNKTDNNINMKRSFVKRFQEGKGQSFRQNVNYLDQLQITKQNQAIIQQFEKDITISQIREKSLAICPSAIDLFIGLNQKREQNNKQSIFEEQKKDLLNQISNLQQKNSKLQAIEIQFRLKYQQIVKYNKELQNLVKIKDFQINKFIQQINALKLENNETKLKFEWLDTNRKNYKQQKLQMNEEIKSLIQSQIKQVNKKKDEMNRQVQRLIVSNEQLGKKLIAYFFKEKQYQIMKDQFMDKEKKYQSKIIQYQIQVKLLTEKIESYVIQESKNQQTVKQQIVQIQRLKDCEIKMKNQEKYEEKYNFIIKQLKELKKTISQFKQKSIIDQKSNLILERILELEKQNQQSQKTRLKLIQTLQKSVQIQTKDPIIYNMKANIVPTLQMTQQSILNTEQSYQFDNHICHRPQIKQYQQAMMMTQPSEEQIQYKIHQKHLENKRKQTEQSNKLQIFRLNKKIEYLKILFIILLFQAITLTFSIQIFK